MVVTLPLISAASHVKTVPGWYINGYAYVVKPHLCI